MLVFRGVTLLMSPNFPSATLRPEMLMCLRLPTVTPVSCKGCSSDLRAPAWNVRAANKGPLVSCSFFFTTQGCGSGIGLSFFIMRWSRWSQLKKGRKKINPVKFLTPDSPSSEKQTRKSHGVIWGGQFPPFSSAFLGREPIFRPKNRPNRSIRPPKHKQKWSYLEKKKRKVPWIEWNFFVNLNCTVT